MGFCDSHSLCISLYCLDILNFSRYDSKSSENGDTVDASDILIYALDTIATNFPSKVFLLRIFAIHLFGALSNIHDRVLSRSYMPTQSDMPYLTYSWLEYD